MPSPQALTLPGQPGTSSRVLSKRLPTLWLPVLLALGLGLRLSLIASPGLHPDEALYASWALRIADGSDPSLLGVLVDKPPLLIYSLAAVFRLAGAGLAGGPAPETLVLQARLPNLLASLASLVVLYVLAKETYDRPTALVALALYAVSPLAGRLAPSVFTDPLLTLWVLVALWATLHRHGWVLGLSAGLSYATKQQALLFLPLLVGAFLAARPVQPRGRGRDTDRLVALRAVKGFLLVAVLVLWWDSQRWQWMPGYWERSLLSYGGLRVASLASLPDQLLGWGELISFVFGSPLLTAALAISVPVVALRAWQQRRTREARFDLVLVGFCAGYGIVHVVFTFEPWDRYALPLIPLLSLLLARAVGPVVLPSADGSPAARAQPGQILATGLLVLGLIHGGWLSARGSLPVGDNRAYDGVPQLAAYLVRPEMADAVLYHHWLGWHYDFYLRDQGPERRWWASPEDVASQAIASVSRTQYIAFPDGRNITAVRSALRDIGLQLEPQFSTTHPDGSHSLTLYAIRP